MGRILLFSTQLLNTGGIESHVIEFSRVLARQGHHVHILVPKCKLSDANKYLFSGYCTRVFFYDSKNSKSGLLFLIVTAFRLLFVKYDALYTNGQGQSISWVRKLFRYKKHVHHHHTSGDSKDQLTWPQSYKQTMRTCDQLIACSQLNASRMSTYLNRSVTAIPVFSRQMEVSLRPIRKEVKKLHFGYFGRLIPEKGIDTLIQLSNDASCSHITFHVWGEGPSYHADLFRTQSNIEYHGVFSRKDELQQILSFLDGYLLLSVHSEGLPVSLLEVMSAGVPWLSTNKGGVPDLKVDDCSTRIIDHNSSYEDIKEAICTFADDCKMNRIDRNALVMFYKMHFSQELLIQKWEKVLFNLKGIR